MDAKIKDFESALAELEGGSDGIAFASGSAATAAVIQLLDAGDHVVCFDDVYGGTRRAFEKVFDDSGIEVQAAATPNDIFDATNWWTSDRGISSFVLETVKYPVYFFWSEEPKVVRND